MDVQELLQYKRLEGKQTLEEIANLSVLNVPDIETPNPDDDESVSHFDELSNFYKTFTQNLVVFDPLDRPIPDESYDEAIKRDDLIKKLDDMPGILGFALNAPMTKDRRQLLDRMFETEVQACNQIGQTFLERAQESSIEFEEDISKHEKII